MNTSEGGGACVSLVGKHPINPNFMTKYIQYMKNDAC